jgi:hypothetical protein
MAENEKDQLSGAWRASIAAAVGCEASDIKTVTELLACDPVGACEAHGRCWAHSEWQRCGSLLRSVSSDPCENIVDGLDGLCGACRELKALCAQHDEAICAEVVVRGVEKNPLTRKTLDKLTCQVPGCTHEWHEGFVLHGACHIKAPSTARYWGTGVVEIRCLRCDREIVEIALTAQDCAVVNVILVCTDPHCKEPPENHSLVLHAPCHRGAGVFVTYQDGDLMFTCGECATLIDVHPVAAGGASA